MSDGRFRMSDEFCKAELLVLLFNKRRPEKDKMVRPEIESNGNTLDFRFRFSDVSFFGFKFSVGLFLTSMPRDSNWLIWSEVSG